MPALGNAKYERFCQLMASGATRTDAAKECGYSDKRANQAGSELYKRPGIATRIEEIRNRTAEITTTASAVSKAWVIDNLIRNVEEAREVKQFSAVKSSLELIGRELGMFIERIDAKFSWDGDTSKLDAGQLSKLIVSLEAMLPAEERAALKAEALQLPEPVGEVLEVKAEEPKTFDPMFE